MALPIPEGRVATTAQEAAEIAAELGGRAVVKAQVHAGGRGKAGGIKVVGSPEEAAAAAAALIGTSLVTFQTGPEGSPIRGVLGRRGRGRGDQRCTSAWRLTARAEGIVAIASAGRRHGD